MAFLERAGVVCLLSSPTSKQWVFLKDVWDGLGYHTQRRWKSRVRTMRDPHDNQYRENRKEAVRSLVSDALEELSKKRH